MLATSLMLGGISAEAQSPVRQILVLQSFDRGNLVLDRFSENFRVDLIQGAGAPVNIVQITVGPTGFVSAPETALVDFIHATFADRPRPDLIVTVAAPATLFARKHRQQLFADVPLLFTAVDRQFLREAPLGEKEAAVAVVNDFPKLVDDILQVLPQTKQVFMVMGSGPIGKLWRQEIENQFQRFHDRVTFAWSDNMSLTEILHRCANLPEHSAIFYFAFGADATGTAHADERVLAELHATANAPLFAAHNVYLGAGVVGGTAMTVDDLASNAADAAIRILNGTPPSIVRVPLQSLGKPIFDWRELQRWGIPESRLPADSEVRYRAPSVWHEHSVAILMAAGGLAIQALLIVGLLFQHRARQRAEIESRRNLALAADASRRATMSALTNSIAHELIQPIASMICNAEALQMMIAASTTPDAIGGILRDIQTAGTRAVQIIDRHRNMLRSHVLSTKPIDLHAVVKESLALVAPEMKARQIDANIDLSSNPCVVDGDQVLMQQVLVNLMMNSMDAMAEMPPTQRRLTIGCAVRDTDVQVSVSDTGTGLPADAIGSLFFTPFVTTKSHGLGIGLMIVRTIVHAHGGTIDARDNPDGGATFTFTLPRSEAPDMLLSLPSEDAAA